MHKTPTSYLQHMLLAITEIEDYIAGYSEQQFRNDNKTVSAVIRQLEIIGEAAGKIDAAQVCDSPIAWRKITGMRHKLIHDYFGVDIAIVWETSTVGLLPLKEYLLKKLAYSGAEP